MENHDYEEWPGEHYKKTRMKAENIGKLQPPENQAILGRVNINYRFKTPPPFVQCTCDKGRIDIGYPIGHPRGDIEQCSYCAHSSIPGWVPQYYTPEQYCDWIRRENDLPEYELPLDTKIYVRSKGGAKDWYQTGTMWEYTGGNRFNSKYSYAVIDTIAGRPPAGWRP